MLLCLLYHTVICVSRHLHEKESSMPIKGNIQILSTSTSKTIFELKQLPYPHHTITTLSALYNYY